jgi:hypothetical protein
MKKRFIDENLKLTPNRYLVLTGDYGDRGNQSSEVWHTIMRLKTLNPFQVFLLRGNHETIPMAEGYGFTRELEAKGLSSLSEKLFKAFEILPLSLFSATKPRGRNKQEFMLFCHGGIEQGYVPHALLDLQKTEDGLFNQKILFFYDKSKLEDKIIDAHLDLSKNNFLWGDFLSKDHFRSRQVDKRADRGFPDGSIRCVNNQFVNHLLSTCYGNAHHSVVGICRGHQHNNNPVGINLKEQVDELVNNIPAKGAFRGGTVFTHMSCGDMYKDGSINPSGYSIFALKNNHWSLREVVDTHSEIIPELETVVEPFGERSPMATPSPQAPELELEALATAADEALEEEVTDALLSEIARTPRRIKRDPLSDALTPDQAAKFSHAVKSLIKQER